MLFKLNMIIEIYFPGFMCSYTWKFPFLSDSLFLCLHVCLSVCLCLSVSLSVFLSVCMSVFMSVSLFVLAYCFPGFDYEMLLQKNCYLKYQGNHFQF